ncbi:MAG: acyl-CoA synthetase [Bacteroidota bacterium]
MLKLINRARQFADRAAIVSDGHTYSYQYLLEQSTQLAQVLLHGKADLEEARIAFLITPGIDYVITQWAIWQAGGIAVPLCTLHPLPSIEYVLEDTGASMVICSRQYVDFLYPAYAKCSTAFHCFDDLQQTTVDGPLPKIRPSRRAMILYTSGTTNLPKGVVTTHDNIDFQIRTLVKAWQWSADDYIINVLPLHHVHGIINVVSCALYSGAMVEFMPRFDAATLWQKFITGPVNVFMAVPTIYFKLISYFDAAPPNEQVKMRQAFNRFRLMISGSAALPVPVLEKWRDITGHTLLERYGMTEIGMALSNPYDGERRPGHVGQPLPGVDIQLFNEQDEVVSEGAPGEIRIKGPNVFLEYWQKPEATAAAFVGGWFCSGDMAVIQQGAYRILGRNSVDIIKSGGYKISALEIEEILRQHPAISDCAVVGVPDLEWGEIVSAGLVLSENKLDVEALKTWLRDRLPAYKAPRQFIMLDDLPRNTIGKVTKKELVQLFQQNKNA